MAITLRNSTIHNDLDVVIRIVPENVVGFNIAAHAAYVQPDPAAELRFDTIQLQPDGGDILETEAIEEADGAECRFELENNQYQLRTPLFNATFED